MNVHERAEDAVAKVAAAMADPARARILYRLMDGQAQTSTELSVIAEVSPSTTSAHLSKLKEANLVKVSVQGRHRYYSLANGDVAAILERLSVLVGAIHEAPQPLRPNRFRIARTCFDHVAGDFGVSLHDRFKMLGYYRIAADRDGEAYELTSTGRDALRVFGIDIEAVQAQRRRFAYGCLDYTERRVHLAGALGAAVLKMLLRRKWVVQDLDSRVLGITRFGRSEMQTRFGIGI